MMKKTIITLALLSLVINGCVTAKLRTKLDMNKLIYQAKQAGKSYLRIPPGEYEIDKTILLKNIKGLTLDGTGVKLVMTQIKHTFFIDHCDQITLKGFTIDYDPLPFTQATITSIKNDNLTFTIHAGYPDLTKNNLYNCLYVFDRKTRLWKKGISDIYGKMKIIDNRHGSFKMKKPQPLLEVGDLVCIDPRRASCIFSCNGTKNVTMENLTIYAAPGATIGGRFCGPNHKFNNITLTRGPRPSGATEERLLSTNADGINYAISNSSPIVENCEFGFMGDDAINFHGPVFPVIKVENPKSFLTVRIQALRPYKDVMPRGQVLRHLAAGTYEKLGTAAFKSIEKVADHGLEPKYLKKFLPEYQKNYYNRCTVYRINLETPLPLKIGQSLDFPAASCSGFVIRNSYFHDNRPRALRLMSSNGIIENNRFERIRGSAIDIGNEYPHWGEAGWVENVIIKNNTLKDVGTGNIFDEYNKVPAAICIFTMNQKGITKYFPGHSNIVIEDNKIENCAPAAIYVYGTKNVVIKNNDVKDSYAPKAIQAGSALKLGPRKAIDIHPESHATQINNKITNSYRQQTPTN